MWCHGNDYPVLLKPCVWDVLYFYFLYVSGRKADVMQWSVNLCGCADIYNPT